MIVEAASAVLAGGSGPGQDRCLTADGLLVVLDGASAFDPVGNPDASDYVDALGDALVTAYSARPDVTLADCLAEAIRDTADALGVVAGTGPSATVAVVRWGTRMVEALALGDSPVLVQTRAGRDVLATDDLAAIAPELRAEYRADLRAGHGYTDKHRATLAELQRRQAAVRNTDGGYWIAEAVPEAAHHAVTRTYDADGVLWCAAATDGAQRPLEHLGHDWDAVARLTSAGLRDVLAELQRWESTDDPSGTQLPRAKRHDDKTIAVLRR